MTKKKLSCSVCTTKTGQAAEQRSVVSTKKLRALCQGALRFRFAHRPNDKFWRDVESKGKHHIVGTFRHRPWFPLWKGLDHKFDFDHTDGDKIRATLVCQMKGSKFVLLLCDFDEEQYLSLGLKAA